MPVCLVAQLPPQCAAQPEPWTRHPEVQSGAWVFAGTRVPVVALFENLADGASMEEFLEWFPGVQEEQVGEVNWEKELVVRIAKAHSTQGLWVRSSFMKMPLAGAVDPSLLTRD